MLLTCKGSLLIQQSTLHITPSLLVHPHKTNSLHKHSQTHTHFQTHTQTHTLWQPGLTQTGTEQSETGVAVNRI